MGTKERPVPLQHFLYHEQEMYRLMSNNKFNESAIPAATAHEKNKNTVINI